MLSKNNKKLQNEKMEPKQQHFTIKRFTVGVASVLVGSTFAIYSGISHVAADDIPETAAELVTKTATTSENVPETEVEVAETVNTEVTAADHPQIQEETDTLAEGRSESKQPQAAVEETQVEPESQPVSEQTRPEAEETLVESDTAESDQPASPIVPETSIPETAPAQTTIAEPTATTETAAEPASDVAALADATETETDPQWPASATDAVVSENGLSTPQISYNRKFWTFQANTGLVTEEVAKGNVIPFSMAEHRTGGTVVTSRDYKVRLQLDERLASYVQSITLTQRDNLNKVITFNSVADGSSTNLWEATLLDIFNEGVVGYAYLAENGQITLKDTIQNILANIPEVAQDPLVYNAYVYDAKSKTALLATNIEGYIVGPSDPLSQKQITPSYSADKDQTKFIGSHNAITYDSTIGENGALVVFYQASKKGAWHDPEGLVFNYQIDPALLPYLEKNGDAYTVELDKIKNTGDGGQYGFVEDKATGNWIPLSYADTTKVADLPLGADGTGVYAPTNIADGIQFATAVSGARPVALRLVYRLNQKPTDIYAALAKEGKAGNSLLFNNYFTDTKGTIQNYSMASNVISFADSDGDRIPDLKEQADQTNPLVSMPNISDVYVSEGKVHGELIFNQAEGVPQTITITDASGTEYGTTTVTPESFTGDAKAQSFDVTLSKALPAAGTNLIVSVNSAVSAGDSESNTVPQTNEVTIKEGPTAKQGLEYFTGEVIGDDAKAAIANTDAFPADAVYTWETKPTTTTAGATTGKVKVSFPDRFDPNYTHELLVDVPATVTSVNLTKATIEVNKPVFHVNTDVLDVEGLLDDNDYVVNSLIKKITLTDGRSYEGEQLKALLTSQVKSYSWSDDPDTSVSQTDLPARLRASLVKGGNVSWDMLVDVVGGEAKTDLTTPWGTAITAENALANVDELKQFDNENGNVTYSWKTEPNFKPGVGVDHNVSGVVLISYPDGTTQEVPVTIAVGDSEADVFAKKEQSATVKPFTAHYGQTVDPLTGIVDPATNNVTAVTLDTPLDTTSASSAVHSATVTFSDGSTTAVEIPINVIIATPKTGVETPWGQVPDAKDMIQNTTELSQFDQTDIPVTYTWKESPNVNLPAGTTERNVPGVVTVTYPDGTTQDVEVSVLVGKSDADKFLEDPDVKTQVVTVKRGENVPAEKALDGIPVEIKTKLNVASASFNEVIDTTKATPGQNYPATVTFADGSTAVVDVLVVVTEQAQEYAPDYPAKTTVAGDPTTIEVEVKDQSGAPVTLPSGTTFAFQGDVPTGVTIDTQTGQITVADPTVGLALPQVVVTYPDGSTSVVAPNLTVYPLPTGGTLEVEVNATLAEDEAKTGIENANDLPASAVYSWKEPVDTTTPGYKTETVLVTYPNGTTKEAEVTVKVGTDEQINEPTGQEVQVELNGTPDPKVGIENLTELPTGTTVAWKEPVDTATPGHKTGTLIVTYPDGTSEEVTVPVKVGTDAQITPPEVQEITTPLNGTPEVTAGIKNLPELPTDTTVVWKEPVDTTTPGHKEGIATVTYPDGSSEEVTVPVKVGTDAQITPPEVQEITTPLNGTPEVTVGIKNLSELPAGTTVVWKEPVDTTTPGHKEGIATVTYPDGSSAEVTVPVKVGTDAQIMPPEVQEITTPLNGTPEVTAGIKNLTELPTGTTVVWKEPVDTTTPGHKEGIATVTYPDGSSAEVPVPVKVGTDAQINEPTGQEVQVELNGTPDPNSGIANLDELPTGTTVAWKEPIDTTTPGHKEGTLVVTYPDGSSEEVSVPVKVGTDAQITPPTGQEIQTDVGGAPDPNSGIENLTELPAGTTVAWKEPVDTTTPGHKEGTLIVTYPDGSSAEVTVPVKVGTDEQINEPTGQEVQVELNGTPDPSAGISNLDELPTKTTVAWKEPVDTTTPGHKEGTLVVSYPDGTSEEVTVPVKVGTDEQINEPTGQEVQVELNGTPDPSAGISNLGELPTGTIVAWKEPVDTTTPGHKEGTLIVSYPDGTSEEVMVPVKVGTDEQINEPTGQEVQVELNGTPDPKAGITNLDELPTGTTVAWKEPVDTTTPGHKEGTLIVTYPDGTSEEVTIPVKVGTDEQINEPTGQEVQVKLNGTPDPSAGISNLDELPTGTTVAWKEPVDTTTSGHKEGTLVVSYPDGTSEEVTVPVKVGTDEQINEPTGQEVQVELNGTPDPKAGITNLDELPTGTTVAWKEPVDTTTPGHKEGTLVVTYPDGTNEEVPVLVKVGTDAQITPPTGQEVQTDVGGAPDPKSGIENLTELPAGTTVAWKEPVDTTTPGHKAGTLIVTYPDGSSTEVTVPVKVGTDEQINEPTGQEVQVELNGTPDPKAGISNLAELPTETTVAWKEPVDTTIPGHKEGTLIVTYPDGTNEEVVVPVKVGTDEQINEPIGQEVKTDVGGTPDPETGISNLTELPAGTVVVWKEPVDTTTPGHKEGTLIVTYPDGTSEEVTVPVKVGTDAQITPPEGQEIKTDVGGDLDPKAGIANLAELPENTTVTWKEPVDTTIPGDKTGTLIVTYPDGSSEEVTVPVKVGTDEQINEPTGQEIKTNTGSAPDPKAGIANLAELPEGTTVAWKEPVDVTTPGDKTGTLIVTYPDGSSEEVTVPVKVGTDAELYTPTGQGVEVALNGTPDPTTGIVNLAEFPESTTVAWKEPVDTTIPGHKSGTLIVTYPDGTSTEVTVPVKVGTDAQITPPIGQEVKTDIGKTLDPTMGIANLAELPVGATVAWKESVDTATPGRKAGTLVVTYPDGSQAEVVIGIKVGTDAEIYPPLTKPITTENGTLPTPDEAIANLGELPQGTVITWVTEPNVTNAGTVQAKILVAYPDGSSAVVETALTVRATSEAATTTSEVAKQLSSNKVTSGESLVSTEQMAQIDGKAKQENELPKAGELPQTGEVRPKDTTFIGMLLAMFASLLGLGATKRKKDDEDRG